MGRVNAAAPTLPPAVVIGLWNQVTEDTGKLEQTQLRFAAPSLHDADRRPGKA